MNFYVLTLFPQAVIGGLNHSITGRAIAEGKISLNCIDIRDFSGNKHNRVDDYPYGGGAGMVLRAQPVYDAYKSLQNQVPPGTRVIYLTPSGRTFNQKISEEFSKQTDLILLCGHYEGVDQRVIDEIVTDELSVGDYILTGGEIAAMAVIDSISRLLPGVLGKEESYLFESFTDNLLEYPQYTRPREFLGKNVPEILLNGNHAQIEKWRKAQSLEITKIKRPDLINYNEGDV